MSSCYTGCVYVTEASRAVQVRAIKPYFNSQSANHISFQEGSYLTVSTYP